MTAIPTVTTAPRVAVPRHLIETLAGTAPDVIVTTTATRFGGGSFDLAEWIARHGLEVSQPQRWQGGTKWVGNCPWNPDHTDRPFFIVRRADGKIGAGCQHNSCGGHNWHSLRDLVEPEWRERRERWEQRQREGESRPAAKNVSHHRETLSGGGKNRRPYLESAPDAAKNVAKSVTPDGDTLSSETTPRTPLTWEQLGCRLGSDVAPENVRWLWGERIALAKLNMIEGNGGEGKSLVLDDLAARLTANLPLPDGSPNPFGEPVTVVLLMAEDDASDTIIPRIMAAGGDPAKVILLDNVPDEHGGHFPTIPDDLDHIERVIERAGAKAVFIDPLVSYLSEDVNSHNDHSVRRALAEIPGIAARRDCAFVAVRHLNKNTAADPKHRGSGAGAFINLARLSLAIGPDPDDASGERRILAVNKVNVGQQAGSLAYHIDTAWVRRGEDDPTLIKTAQVVWEGESTLTAADILGARADSETRTASEVAKDLLLQLLTTTPQDEEQVWKAVEKAGVSRSSYMRARKALGVKATRVGGAADAGKWQVSLPERDQQPAAKSVTTTADTLSQSGALPDREHTATAPKSVTPARDTLRAADRPSRRDFEELGGLLMLAGYPALPLDDQRVGPGEQAWRQWVRTATRSAVASAIGLLEDHAAGREVA